MSSKNGASRGRNIVKRVLPKFEKYSTFSTSVSMVLSLRGFYCGVKKKKEKKSSKRDRCYVLKRDFCLRWERLLRS